MIVQGPIDTVLCPLTNILMLHNSRTGNEKRVSGIWSLYPKCLFKCCKWVPWQHLDGSWFALYFHRQRNMKFSFRRHILYWYNKINLLVEQNYEQNFKSLRAQGTKTVGMDPMTTHCRKLIVTGIYQVKSYMSYLQQYTKIIKKLTLKFYFS